jgi:nicotinate-nucleotide adenylyltransferase
MREAPGREPIVLASRRVDVSSTEVRSRVRAGLSIRGFVPDAVAAYVAEARLYR